MRDCLTPEADPRKIVGTLEHLCKAIGPRPAGSREEARARRWVVRKFQELHMASPRIEEFSFVNSHTERCEGEWFAGRRSGRLDLRPCAYSRSRPDGCTGPLEAVERR